MIVETAAGRKASGSRIPEESPSPPEAMAQSI
jgi:hypothetical protein